MENEKEIEKFIESVDTINFDYDSLVDEEYENAINDESDEDEEK